MAKATAAADLVDGVVGMESAMGAGANGTPRRRRSFSGGAALLARRSTTDAVRVEWEVLIAVAGAHGRSASWCVAGATPAGLCRQQERSRKFFSGDYRLTPAIGLILIAHWRRRPEGSTRQDISRERQSSDMRGFALGTGCRGTPLPVRKHWSRRDERQVLRIAGI
jgi:hypothetical protein